MLEPRAPPPPVIISLRIGLLVFWYLFGDGERRIERFESAGIGSTSAT
jgi:hypothetical protein